MKLISIQQFCKHYDIPISFIDSLFNFELIELIQENNTKFINQNQVNIIEKLIRLHYDLDINFEGLDVVLNLLNQIEYLQNELTTLNNQLDFYRQFKN